jgi:hypothetical protein
MTRKLITAFVSAAIVGSFMTATTIVAEEGFDDPDAALVGAAKPRLYF